MRTLNCNRLRNHDLSRLRVLLLFRELFRFYRCNSHPYFLCYSVSRWRNDVTTAKSMICLRSSLQEISTFNYSEQKIIIPLVFIDYDSILTFSCWMGCTLNCLGLELRLSLLRILRYAFS